MTPGMATMSGGWNEATGTGEIEHRRRAAEGRLTDMETGTGTATVIEDVRTNWIGIGAEMMTARRGRKRRRRHQQLRSPLSP